MLPEGWGLVGAVMVILGFNFTFIPQFLLGNMGMPRRYYAYPAKFWPLNVASTAGATVLALGLVVVLVYTLVSIKWGPVAGSNPWHSRGYEWGTPSPPPVENWETTPVFDHGPHDYQEGATVPPTVSPEPEPTHAS
jgi:cytochrome c oxidase subunit 1